MAKIIPVILSGGAGTRLWPISRRMHPKPFMEVAGKPLLAHAIERASLVSDEALIVTNDDYYHLTDRLLEAILRTRDFLFTGAKDEYGARHSCGCSAY